MANPNPIEAAPIDHPPPLLGSKWARIGGNTRQKDTGKVRKARRARKNSMLKLLAEFLAIQADHRFKEFPISGVIRQSGRGQRLILPIPRRSWALVAPP
jgi:hypothetical protein